MQWFIYLKLRVRSAGCKATWGNNINRFEVGLLIGSHGHTPPRRQAGAQGRITTGARALIQVHCTHYAQLIHVILHVRRRRRRRGASLVASVILELTPRFSWQGRRAKFFDPPVVADVLRLWTALSSCCTITGEGCSAPNDGRGQKYPRPSRNNRAVVRHAVSGQSETDTGKGKLIVRSNTYANLAMTWVSNLSVGSLSVGLVGFALSVPLILTIALAMGYVRRQNATSRD